MPLRTTNLHNTAQNSSDNFPHIHQTVIIVQMMSTGWRGSNVDDDDDDNKDKDDDDTQCVHLLLKHRRLSTECHWSGTYTR